MSFYATYPAAGAGGSGGVTVHGALTGLAADDHTQYHNDARALTWLQGQSIGSLLDVDITTVPPVAEQVLAWDGTNFVPVNGISSFVPPSTGAILGYITGIGWIAYNVGNGLSSSSGTLSLGGTLSGAVVFDMNNQSFSLQSGSTYVLESDVINLTANTSMFLRLPSGTTGQYLKLSNAATGLVEWDTLLGDNLGDHLATQDLDMNGFDIVNVGNVEDLQASSVALTGQVLVPLLMNNPLGTFYGTHAAPATTGNISISAAGVPGGWAEVLYQAGTVPTITGITDQDVATNWDASNINVIVVYQHADGTYIAMHCGTR